MPTAFSSSFSASAALDLRRYATPFSQAFFASLGASSAVALTDVPSTPAMRCRIIVPRFGLSPARWLLRSNRRDRKPGALAISSQPRRLFAPMLPLSPLTPSDASGTMADDWPHWKLKLPFPSVQATVLGEPPHTRWIAMLVPGPVPSSITTLPERKTGTYILRL